MALCAGAFGASAPSSWAAQAVYVQSFEDGLSAPTSLHVGVDQLAVLEPFSSQVRLLTPDGILTARINIQGDAIGLSRLDEYTYLFCDRGKKHVVAIDVRSESQWSFLQSAGDPVDVIVDGSSCYVLDAGSARILTTDLAGNVASSFPLVDASGDRVPTPSSFGWDPSHGVFHVLDQLSSRVFTFSRTGVAAGEFGSFGSSEGTLTRGGEIACDPDGYVYVNDRYQGRIAVFDPAGTFVANLDPNAMGWARLSTPTGLAVDEQGLVYTASTESRSVHVLYLDKSAAPAPTLGANPIYPAEGDTVSARGLSLVASVHAAAEILGSIELDFRLVAAAEPEILLAEAARVAISAETQA